MNFVFNKKDGKIVSISDNNIDVNSEETFLKTTFSTNYNNLSIWRINASINYPPNFLRVKFDSTNRPEILLYKNKAVYRITEEDKKKYEEEKIKNKNKLLAKILPRNLHRIIKSDLIKFWVNSPYTNPYLKDSIKNFDYFIDNRIIPVSWWGPFTDAGGYANMNREIVFRLHNHYILPKIDICPTAPQISATARYYISKYSSFDLSKFKRHLKIWSFTPIPHPPNPGKNVFFTMMETESLHPEFARICNVYADEIWVPSTHNATVFKEYGIKKPIFVMPLGVDELLYYNRDIAPNGIINDTKCFVDLLGKPVSKGINSFRFLSLFGWSYRKGTDILIKSFVKEFNDNDDVALIIVSRHSGSPEQSHINVIKADVDRYAKSIRRSNFPQIILHPHVIPEQQMPDIYKMGQVFLHCSRGEGWNLPVIEAAACGLPVISCNNTGMSEYLTDDNAFLIKTNQKEICNPEMHWITAYYHNQLFPKLGSEQIEQSQNHMKFCRNNYEKALLKGKELKKLVFEKYTWKHAVERIAQRIHQII